MIDSSDKWFSNVCPSGIISFSTYSNFEPGSVAQHVTHRFGVGKVMDSMFVTNLEGVHTAAMADARY